MLMFRMIFRPDVQAVPASNVVVPASLIGGNLLFNIIANASFKLSAGSPTWRGFLVWQVVGNLAGFITVLTLTGLLRFVPLRVAYPVTAGLAVIGVQVAAARLLFHEPISPTQWMGTLLVLVGILLVGGR
jgi:multidrug transporter EmrE-like cation transporter